MPDRVVQACHDSDAGTTESMHPFQSVWMAHWMRTSCDSASGVHNQFSLHDGKKKDDHDTKQVPVLVQTDEPRKVTRMDGDVTPGNISEYGNAWRCPGGSQVESDILQSAIEVEAVTEGERVEMRNDTAVKMNFRNVRSVWQSFPINFDKRESILASKKDPASNDRHILRPQIDDNSGRSTTDVGTSEPHCPSGLLGFSPTGVSFSSRDQHPTEGISLSSEQLVKPHKALGKRSLPVSRTLLDGHDDQTSMTSNIMLYGFESRGAAVQSLWNSNEEVDRSSTVPESNDITKTSFPHVEPKHCICCSCSTFLAHDKKMDNQLPARYSGSSHLEPKDGALQLYDHSISDFRFPICIREGGERHSISGSRFLPSYSSPPGVTRSEDLNHGCHSLHRMPTCPVHDVETLKEFTTVASVEGVPIRGGKRHNISGSGFLPSHSSLPGVTESEDLNHGCHSLHRMPTCPFHNVETVRACTTLDNVEVVPGVTPKISQIGAKLSEGGKLFRESSVSTKFKGNAFHELLTLRSDFVCHSKQGPKLQHLVNSMDCEGKGDVWDVKTGSLGSKNKSSAETDTLDIDVFLARKSLPGEASYSSNKVSQDVMVGQSPAKSQATIASLKEKVGSRKTETESPDLNQELSSFSAKVGALDNRELSTSRTESLDVERLLSHVEQPENSNLTPHQDSPQCMEPDSRWVKRLKLSASNSLAHCTKSTKMGDALSNEKVNKLFGKTMHYSSSSKQSLGKHCGEEHMDDKSSSMDSVKKYLGLSHSWIRRWYHNQAATQWVKPSSNVVCEPRISKGALDEFPRKQFPSIAAMALMGKAMNGYQSCEFRKRGSFVVWNTEGL